MPSKALSQIVMIQIGDDEDRRFEMRAEHLERVPRLIGRVICQATTSSRIIDLMAAWSCALT